LQFAYACCFFRKKKLLAKLTKWFFKNMGLVFVANFAQNFLNG